MNQKIPAIVVILLGALFLLASLLADVTGIGDDPGFGRQQIMGTILGVVVLAVGAYLFKKADKGKSEG